MVSMVMVPALVGKNGSASNITINGGIVEPLQSSCRYRRGSRGVPVIYYQRGLITAQSDRKPVSVLAGAYCGKYYHRKYC